jgi:hypothetical protein
MDFVRQHFGLVLMQPSAPTYGRSRTAPVTLANQAVFPTGSGASEGRG